MSNWQRIPRIHRRQGNRRAVRERTEGCVQTTCLSSGALRAPTFDMSASHSCRRGSIQIPRGFVPTYHIDLENVSTPTGVSQSTTADYKPADAGRSRQRRFDDSELPPDGRMLLRGGRGRTTRGQRHETELGNGGHAGCPPRPCSGPSSGTRDKGGSVQFSGVEAKPAGGTPALHWGKSGHESQFAVRRLAVVHCACSFRFSKRQITS
jgi:hypothetical protein